MNIIKTFSKYIKNGVTKIIAHFTTDYAVYSPEFTSNLDEMLININSRLDGLFAFLQPKKVTLNGAAGWTIASTLECIVCDNTCYLNGVIAKLSGTYSGEYNLGIFPEGIRPKFDVKLWYPIIINGIEYKTHIEVRRNGNLNLFFYDAIPAGLSIPIHFTFQMTTDYIG